jgi:hypothetical protein
VANPETLEAPARQVPVTIVAPVERARLARLRRTLAEMGADPGHNPIWPFAGIPRAHFARLVLLDPTTDLDGTAIDAQLIYIADVDEPGAGGITTCLREMVDTAGPGLDRVFGACAGYPRRQDATVDNRLAFLRDHAVTPAAAYVNTPGRTLQQILRENDLRLAIGDFIDKPGDWSGTSAEDVRRAIQEFVRSEPGLEWAMTPTPGPSLSTRIADGVDLVRGPLTLLALSPVLVPSLPLLVLLIRRSELRDDAPHIRPTPEHARRLAEQEDRAAHNQFSALGFVKPGLLRRAVIDGVTRGIQYASRHVYRHANLAGVKTIHFARWIWLDDRRRMLFASNYDGSLESYNDDFIDKVWWGLNAVFTNGVGYPKTDWLIFGGAKREQEFKDFLRCRQVPTQVWYSAYPELTALNIDNNARLRAGLHGPMTTKETEAWLRRI